MAALFHSEPPIGVRAAPPLALLALTLVRVGLFVGSFFFFSFLLIIFYYFLFCFSFCYEEKQKLFGFFFWFFGLFVFLIFFSELSVLYLDMFPCNIPIVIYSSVPYELAGNLLLQPLLNVNFQTTQCVTLAAALV